MKKILVVDDEKAIVTLLENNLKKAGYSVDTVSEGVSAYNMAVTGKYDFILLDLMLPGMDGIEITRRLRQERIETPIIILTARDQEYDKIIGLELGADDYLTKPFSPREVIARIKAISRRITSSSDEGGASQPAKVEKEFYEYAGFTVDLAKVSVARNGERVKLTPKEFELLAYFVKRPGRVLSREKLLNGVWGYDYVGQTRMVDMHVSHLREKLEDDPKHPVYIQTARGFGYRFNGDAK